jgi:hypothetical protein
MTATPPAATGDLGPSPIGSGMGLLTGFTGLVYRPGDGIQPPVGALPVLR